MKRGLIIAKGTLEELTKEFSENTKGCEVEQLNIIYVRGNYVLSAVVKNKKNKEAEEDWKRESVANFDKQAEEFKEELRKDGFLDDEEPEPKELPF